MLLHIALDLLRNRKINFFHGAQEEISRLNAELSSLQNKVREPFLVVKKFVLISYHTKKPFL